jgi:outer membrane protein OmpA-like peptidoglycan-associated protein
MMTRSKPVPVADPFWKWGFVWGFLLTALVSVAVLASACGPPRNPALEAAKLEYERAQSDLAVVQYAGKEMATACVALAEGEEAVEDGDEKNADHFAALAETELRTAREVGRAGDAQTRKLAVKRETSKVEAELAGLHARETARGILLSLSDVFFEVDSAQLKPEGMQNLAELAAFLNANPDRALAIEGYADSTGTSQYNQQLSRRRAAAVQSFLVASGVSPSRVSAQGFGERFPVASNHSPSGRALNRRVEMLVLNPGEPIRVTSVPLVRYPETVKTRTTY